uniref:folate gamma-glutamyl hydrolase n=1 Tax=Leptocylindrus danicus TaxID=163516 RepID=A0A7S2PDS4_9STRA|mmetsp:Transcript_29264/g.42969  ORF Transcript_29264/g.42969 Transcript_29264/m.42969 type:complete len:353 (+) Transcript_29264:112-1170(+)
MIMTRKTAFLSSLTAALSLITSSSIVAVVQAADRPVIGIFTRLDAATDEHYIAASYVKWLESAGARSIPIHADTTNETELKDLFQQINGILFPGGGDNTNLDAARIMWDMAKDRNSSGEDYFPIWGTCLGFEWLLQLTSDAGADVLQSGFEAEDVSMALEFTHFGIEESNMFARSDVRDVAASERVAYNHHHQGIEPRFFLADKGLVDMFAISSVNLDLNGRPFVSSIEARDGKFPYYGVQWHPEKNNFEFGTKAGTDEPLEAGINHSRDAVMLSEEMANVFVSEARRSAHLYTEVERFPLVWAYENKPGVMFEQVFIIPSLREEAAAATVEVSSERKGLRGSNDASVTALV